jgi:hypothetical protein
MGGMLTVRERSFALRYTLTICLAASLLGN